MRPLILLFIFFFFNATPTTETYTLSLHDALPIFGSGKSLSEIAWMINASYKTIANTSSIMRQKLGVRTSRTDRKSTRLNSSHSSISYAVFCLKKKKNNNQIHLNTTSTHNRAQSYK